MRRIILLGTPITVELVTFLHPSNPLMANEWLIVHILQLPLFGGFALAVYLLPVKRESFLFPIGCIALGIFVIFYSAWDAIVGIGVGTLLVSSVNDPTLIIAANLLQTDSLTNFIGLIGAVGWMTGVLAMAISLSYPKNPPKFSIILTFGALVIGVNSWFFGAGSILWWFEVMVVFIGFLFISKSSLRIVTGLIVLTAIFFGTAHVPPYSSLACSCFFIAILQLEFGYLRRSDTQSSAKNISDTLNR